MSSLAHSPVNDQRYDDLLKEAKSFGADAAAGKDSLPKLAHKVVRAAHEGVIDTNKDTDGRDAASRIYGVYAEGQSKKAIHDHTDGGTKANVSKLRKLIEMGVMPIIDPVDVMNRTVVVRDTLRKSGVDLKPAYASYVDVARAQLDSPGAALTDTELQALVTKAEPKEKTVEAEIKAIHKKLEKLITGEGGLKDQSPELIAAEEQVRARLAALMEATSDKFYAEFTAGANSAPDAIEQAAA